MPAVRGVDLLRYLVNNRHAGISPARARLRQEALALIGAEDLAEASYSYRIVPLERPASAILYADGEQLHAPILLPESGELTALGCGVCTLGPKIEDRLSQLFQQKRASLALAIDEIATEMIFALGRRIQDRMLSECYRRGLTMAGELHAGDPGLDIEAQAAVLRLAEAHKIGVSLHGHHIMRPLKSGSVVLGVGRDLPEVSWSRCDTCPSANKCSFGRRKRPVAIQRPA